MTDNQLFLDPESINKVRKVACSQCGNHSIIVCMHIYYVYMYIDRYMNR